MYRIRANSRLRDIAESQSLLLELITSEPTVIQCFKIVESTCLSQGIFCRLDGEEVTDKFQRFIEDYYVPFCKAAIHSIYAFGFVPWRLRKVGKGDMVPEVLPPGTFNWHTELGPSEKRGYDKRKPEDAQSDENGDQSRLVVYRVIPTAGGVKQEDVHIFTVNPPSLDISVNSNLYATVPSPLAHLLTDYKNLREAQIRRSHADAWNTTARVVSTFKPSLRVEDNPTQYLMDFVHENYYEPPAVGQSLFPPFQAHNVWQRENIMRRQFMETPSNHHPEVYALPRDHDVVSQTMLQPCEDLGFLLDKYRRDVGALMGIPAEMIMGKSEGGQETVRRTLASGRIFSTNMHEMCRHLQTLLRRVYCKIYKADPETVQFLLVPMPRLEIETIEDFKVLYEIGALTPDMSIKLSKILLGEDATAKKPKTQGGLQASKKETAATQDAVKQKDAKLETDEKWAKQQPQMGMRGLR
jgi:hypothetical protein